MPIAPIQPETAEISTLLPRHGTTVKMINLWRRG